MLRIISIVLNTIVVTLSALLFSYTFVAKTHLQEHTRAFVSAKTLSYSKPLAELMRSGLDAPLSQKLLTKKLRSEIESELSVYDFSPAGYVARLTAEQAPRFGASKVAIFKEKLHHYYQSTLGALVCDLRIFSASNLLAGGFAMWLLLTTKLRNNGKVIAFSFVVFSAVAFSTFSYLEGVTFLRVLLKSHLGWWYPGGVIVLITSLIIEYGLHIEKEAEH
jgi:hypothetical protein